MEKPGETAGTVLVAVPGGKGLMSTLAKQGFRVRACKNLTEVIKRFDCSTDAIVLAQATLAPSRIHLLAKAVATQPPWSDVPVILLAKAGSGGKKARQCALEILGDANVLFLPPPFRIVALVTALRAAAQRRRHQRAALRAIQDLLDQREAALASISDAFSVLDRDWRYTYVNKRVLELTGKQREELVGHVIWEIFPEAVGTEFYQRCHRAVETQQPDQFEVFYKPWGRWVDTRSEVLSPGSSGHYEIHYRARDVVNSRERWLEEKGRVLLDDAGRPARFLGTILEITERKNAEDALKKAKQDAEEANRAKDQFLAMLSHELRTPLTPVLMTIASLQRNHDIPDSARRDLDVLRRNVELEALLIDDLLDLTRIAHGKLELRNDAIDVHASLSYALGISASDLNEKQIQVQQDLAAKEHHCWADAARLQQVFWNIIKNAVKFTPARGQLCISTRNDAEHYIIIDFTDTGIGVNSELQPRIFDAFEQGGKGMTNRYGGLGLGLAISKRVIDLHGGKISVQSGGQGTGATFTIKLKAMETSLLEGPAYPLDGDGSARDRAEILLVEDHEDTARALRRMLENAGYQVGYASTLASARDLAAKRHFQLVISDLGLPDGSGLDLMGELGDSGQLRGIALSGFGSESDVAAAKAAGFAAHFTKPVDWERLRHTIHRLLDGREASSTSPT
jgi:PAS domain S-box-containing protein